MAWGLNRHKKDCRVIHNSLTHFTKSVYLNNAKDLNLRPKHRKRNSARIFYVERALSSFDGRQGSKLSKNGGDECKKLSAFFSTHCALKF